MDIYRIPLTGAEIEKKLRLISGDEQQVEIKAEKISAQAATETTDNELTLTTKGYVDEAVTKATSSNKILSGTDEPTDDLGNDGDIYIQYKN